MSDELKPCPFCGMPFNIVEKDTNRYFIEHGNNCPIIFGTYSLWGFTDKEWLIKELNTRPIEDTLCKVLEVAMRTFDNITGSSISSSTPNIVLEIYERIWIAQAEIAKIREETSK